MMDNDVFCGYPEKMMMRSMCNNRTLLTKTQLEPCSINNVKDNKEEIIFKSGIF